MGVHLNKPQNTDRFRQKIVPVFSNLFYNFRDFLDVFDNSAKLLKRKLCAFNKLANYGLIFSDFSLKYNITERQIA